MIAVQLTLCNFFAYLQGMEGINPQIDTVRTSGGIDSKVPTFVKMNGTSNWMLPLFVKKALSIEFVLSLTVMQNIVLLRITVNMPSLDISQCHMCVFTKFDWHENIEVISALPGVWKDNTSFTRQIFLTLNLKQSGLLKKHEGSFFKLNFRWKIYRNDYS